MSKVLTLLALLLFLGVDTQVFSAAAADHYEWREKKFTLVLEQLQRSLRESLPELESMIDLSQRPGLSAPDLHSNSELCQTHFNEALLYLFRLSTYQMSKEKTYTMFIEQLRAALNTRYYQTHQFEGLDIPLVDMIQTVSMQLYQGINIQPYLNKLWQTIAVHGGYELGPRAQNKNLFPSDQNYSSIERLYFIRSRLENLLSIYRGIKSGKSLLSVTFSERTKDILFGGVTWLSFDPASMGNVPYVKYRLRRSSGEHELTYIRMPTPTLNSDKSASICPEFKAYLAYLKNRGYKHLYLNFQDNIRPQLGKIKSARQFVKALGIGNESFRAEAVEMLAQSPEFRDTAIVITFSKDSRFYKQNSIQEKEIMSARTFIERYLRTMFDLRNEGFYVPPSWRTANSSARQDVRQYLQNIHQWFFKNKPFLDWHERRDFIEISYFFIGDYASRGVFSANQTCKTGIDRAGTANTMTFLMSLVMFAHGKAFEQAGFEQLLASFEAMLFSDAIMAKKREIKRSRLLRFRSAAMRMLDEMIDNPDLLDDIAQAIGNTQPILGE
ncbi:MAG: hypothetical protein AB8G05_19205 [Oligoflexales bacterium]